ncbi:stress response translation initiation inhibitor YciH [Candidatus Geothermarchaeota archaeon]|nr:MAG: stress response translation initiation inhibitor YciH [Candidatus Geothermarchaeota archaeon]RLG61601.1 MAG: stress response translation initiation inhibitor YciH [Candidatus Geothermarchaeota archaeon]HEW93103.1 stress response translation initiation inhibitor YciH [Thermoprotei archaeon]
MEICPVCGLPKDLCICGKLESEEVSIKIRVERRRYNKPATIIEGINPKTHNLNKLAKKLKRKLACGGTVKDDKIILLGDHRAVLPDILSKMGFDTNKIEVF